MNTNTQLAATGVDITATGDTIEQNDVELQKPILLTMDLAEEGAKRVELMQQVWGKHGKAYIFACMSLCFIA
jgi:hypothetical protein